MKSKIILLFAFFFSTLYFSQDIYEKYPEGQTDYIGGNIQFYKDFRKVILEKNLQPCENKNENINFRIVIYPDHKIKYVKNEDSNWEENKCAFDLSKEVAKNLTGWNPAVVDGRKVAAVTSFWIIPRDLFQELKENYDPVNDMEIASYDGGIDKFRKKVFQSMDLKRFIFHGKFKLLVTFVIQQDGKMSNIKLVESTGSKDFDDMVISGIASIKNKWTPASISGIPIRSRFKLPLAFSMN